MSSAKSILIVDDEKTLLDLFTLAFKGLPYQVVTANGGRAALEYLAKTVPELIILDLAMPEMNGVEVLRRLRSDSRFESTKVIVLSAVPFMLDSDSAQMANLILSKPIRIKELERIVLEQLKPQA